MIAINVIRISGDGCLFEYGGEYGIFEARGISVGVGDLIKVNCNRVQHGEFECYVGLLKGKVVIVSCGFKKDVMEEFKKYY